MQFAFFLLLLASSFGAFAAVEENPPTLSAGASAPDFALPGVDGKTYGLNDFAGHARLQAARRVGMSEVPVIVLGHLTAKQRRVLAIADNQLPLNAGWDEPITTPGDLWTLGNHRLLCGDATSMEAIETVLDGGTADMVFVDPPYNVGYQGKTADKLKIRNSCTRSTGLSRKREDTGLRS
jgi:hypothetical protein